MMKKFKMTKGMRDYNLSFLKTVVSVCRFFGIYSVCKNGYNYEFDTEIEMNEYIAQKNW